MINIQNCLFCEKGEQEGELHQILTLDPDNNVRTMATELNDAQRLARIVVEADMGHMLDPEDVDSLFGIVKGAKAKWRDIGRELGFTLKEMDEIVQKKGISQDQDYFQELLDLWLNWAPPQRPFPCTEDLLDALRRIGQHRLALKLEGIEDFMGKKELIKRSPRSS
ncbi:hypothetical protein EMCRGX_G006944 [Ephydatia muelleri]